MNSGTGKATGSVGQTSAKSSDARAVKSGMALRGALLELVGSTPFDQITIRDLCAKAGIHYATFFRHFQTKEDLLSLIAREEISQLNRLTLSVLAEQGYHAGFHTLCSYVDENRCLWATLLNGGAAAAMREEWLRQSTIAAQPRPRGESWLPTELGVLCAATLIAETLGWWLAQPKDAYGVDAVADILYRLVSSSVLTES